jgi:hypothetical protein
LGDRKLGGKLRIKNRIKNINNIKGLTLIEVITSVALLALTMLFFTTFFLSAITYINDNKTLSTNYANADAGIENKMAGIAPDANSIVTQTSGNFTITFTGVTVNVAGNYVRGTDSAIKTAMYYFNPNP